MELESLFLDNFPFQKSDANLTLLKHYEVFYIEETKMIIFVEHFILLSINDLGIHNEPMTIYIRR